MIFLYNLYEVNGTHQGEVIGHLRAPDSCVIVVGTFLDKVSKEDCQFGKIDDLLRKVEELTRHCCHKHHCGGVKRSHGERRQVEGLYLQCCSRV